MPTCVTINSWRSAERRAPSVLAITSISVEGFSSAGAVPNTTPEIMDTITANKRTRPSTLASDTCGIPAGESTTNRRTITTASPQPARPPASARTMLSVSLCRNKRPRPAPTTARTANSFFRPTLCDKTRFATFAQAIRNTAPAEASSSHAVRRASWTCRSRIVRTCSRNTLRNGGGADCTKS